MTATRTPIIDDQGEIRDLTADDVEQFRPAKDVLPSEWMAKFGAPKGTRGPQKKPTKVITTIRLSPEVVDAFKASGPKWQSRIDQALQEWLKTHKVAAGQP